MMEAIILAGGLGTRLRGEVPDLPKCMAPVAGRPFIDYVISFLNEHNIEKIIFSLGYKHDAVLTHLESKWTQLNYDFTVETTPLGTGGGIRLAAEKAEGKSYFVLNGDTFFAVDLKSMSMAHNNKNASVTMALKKMTHFDRYGSVIVASDNKILAFKEKSYKDAGLINGGVYIIDAELLKKMPANCAFSFEKDVLEKDVNQGYFYGFISDGYFIDIGIPDDYKKANNEFRILKSRI